MRLRRFQTIGALFILCAAGTTALAPPVLAQDAPSAEMKAGARAAAEQGNTAFKEGRFTEALDLFNRAEALIRAPTHQLMIARTHVALGQLVAAQDAYRKMTVEPLAANAPAPFRAAQAQGQKELAELEPRIPLVKVSVSDPGAKGLAVVKDGKPMPGALVGIPHPVNPGKHTFQATAEGFQSETVTINVKEREKANVSLELRPARGTPAGPAAGGNPGDPAAPSDSGQPDTASTGGTSIWPIVGYSAIGVGAVGIGVGVTFLVLGLSKRSEADDLSTKCQAVPGVCTKESKLGKDLTTADDDATAKNTIGLISMIAGGVFAAGGVTVVILTRKKSAPAAAFHFGGDGDPARAKVSITPWIGPQGAGVNGVF